MSALAHGTGIGRELWIFDCLAAWEQAVPPVAIPLPRCPPQPAITYPTRAAARARARARLANAALTQPIAGTRARFSEMIPPVTRAAAVVNMSVQRLRTNTVSPVGSEPETSFIEASPSVNSAVARTMAAMPLILPATGLCWWVRATVWSFHRVAQRFFLWLDSHFASRAICLPGQIWFYIQKPE
jgi:hypothetical protein